MSYMPSGMMAAPVGPGVVGSMGNTPMADSSAAIRQLLTEQVSQNQLSMQVMSQMSTEIHQQTKEITKNFHEQRRLVEEMTLLQTQAIDQILTQIRAELNP